MKTISILLILLVLFTSCSSSAKEYDLDNVHIIKGKDVKELIKQKKYTAIYFWTTWCSPSKNTLNKKIKPILDSNERNDFQILVIGVSKKPEAVQEIINSAEITQDVYVVNDHLFDNPLADKLKINKMIGYIDDDISFINRVPVVLIVDENSKVYSEVHHVSDLIKFVNGKLIQ